MGKRDLSQQLQGWIVVHLLAAQQPTVAVIESKIQVRKPGLRGILIMVAAGLLECAALLLSRR